jgi:hypothetical protein
VVELQTLQRAWTILIDASITINTVGTVRHVLDGQVLSRKPRGHPAATVLPVVEGPPVSVVPTPLNSTDSGSNGPETVDYYTKGGAMSRRIHMLTGPRLDRMGEVSAMSVS